MTDSDIKRILVSSKVIAAVGASDNAARPSFGVMKYLLRNGYTVIPVNPNYTTVLGIPTVASLADIKGPIDVVQIFRRPTETPAAVDAALAIAAPVIWMQDGAGNEEAAAKARAAGRTVIVDNCIMRQHRRLIGDRGM